MKTIVALCALMFCVPFMALGSLDYSTQEGLSLSLVNVAHAQDARLSNPLNGTNGEIDDIGELFDDILSNIIIPVTLAVGVLFIVLAGLKFVMAAGNDQNLGPAKKNLLNVVIGVAIVLAAEILLDILLATLGEIGNVN